MKNFDKPLPLLDGVYPKLKASCQGGVMNDIHSGTGGAIMDTELTAEESAQTVRWAIIGTGTIASQFARDMHYAPNVELAAICSRSHANGGAFMRSFGAEKAVTDIAEIASDPSIDAVYIATPNHMHAEQAITLLAHGKAVLIEKPIACSAEEAAAIHQVAEDHGALVMEGLWTRFLPAVKQAKLMIDYRLIGSIRYIWAELAYRKSYSPDTRFFNAEQGGGSLLDLGIYPISLAIDLLGKPNEVYGSWEMASTGVDLSADIELRFEDDARARITCGFDRDGANQLVIEGTKGALVLEAPFLKAKTVTFFSNPDMALPVRPFGQDTLSRLRRSVGRHMPLLGKQTEKPFEGGGLQFEIEAFSNAVRQGRREVARMPVRDSLMALGIIDAVLATEPENRQVA